PFTTFAHGKLADLATTGGTVGVPSASEVTFVAAFGEKVAGAAIVGGVLVVTFTTATVPAGPNFFEVHFGAVPNANDSAATGLAGTGYNDGPIIMSGTVTNVDNSTSFVESSPISAGALDQNGTNQYPALSSVGGGGHAEFSGPIAFADPGFFTFPAAPGTLL